MADWFAVPASIVGKDMVLLGHRETMFTAFVPMAPFEIVTAMFRQVVASELARIKVPSEIIRAEMESLADMSVAKTNDRSTLGSLNQLAWDLESAAQRSWEEGDLNLLRLQIYLNGTPHVKREESFAVNAVRKRLGLDPLDWKEWKY